MTWPIVPLGQVAETTLGKMLDKGKTKGHPHVPYLRNVNVQWGRIDTHDLLTMEVAEADRDRFAVRAGDLLVCEGGEIGRCAIWHGQTDYLAFQKALHRVRPGHALEVRFLRYVLEHHAQTGQLNKLATGSTIAHLPQQQLRRVPVPLPPLDEQRRIVDLLEDHLSRLDAAGKYLDAAERRTGLLWAAGLSDLTVPPDARGLLAGDPAVLGQESPPAVKLPSGWQWVRWADVGTSENGKPFPSRDYQDEGIRLLRPGNLGPQGVLTWRDSNTRFMPNSYRVSHSGSVLQAGDLVMNLTAQSLRDDFLGRTCLVREGDEALLNQRIARLRVTGVDNGFALAVFRSRLFRHYVKSLSTGSLIQHMFTSQLNRFWIPVPPASEQRRIARAADRLEADIARPTEMIRRQVQRSSLLRGSLLAATFSGRLMGVDVDASVAEEVMNA